MHEKREEATITEDEAALYDRQIRLWGLDAQRRLRGARVLLAGLGGLGAEVAKNIILSGIKSITLLDDANVKKDDFTCQFLVDRADLDKNRAESSSSRAQQLNPMVEVTTDTENISSKDESFFTQFDVVCATCCSRQELVRINDICHKNSIQFFAGDIYGFYGFMFADLNEHEYADEVAAKPKKGEEEKEKGDGEPAAKKAKTDPQETVTVKKQASFTRLQEALEVDWSGKSVKRTPNTFFIMQIMFEFHTKHGRGPEVASMAADKEELAAIRDAVLEKLNVGNKDIVPQDFTNFCFAELSPVCAVVGGILGQEIIKAVSKKDPPHNNFFFYNGVEGSGMVDCIKK